MADGTVLMTREEWKRMYHYTCSMPTSPRPGFVYATGPHQLGSDPSTDVWYRVEVVSAVKPGYCDHVPTRIVLPLELTGQRVDHRGRVQR